jgi:hypothetical protein
MRARIESLTFFGATTVSVNDIQVNDVQHSNTPLLHFIIDLSNLDLLFLATHFHSITTHLSVETTM